MQRKNERKKSGGGGILVAEEYQERVNVFTSRKDLKVFREGRLMEKEGNTEQPLISDARMAGGRREWGGVKR